MIGASDLRNIRNIRLTLEYDGTDFVGWQRQPNAAHRAGAPSKMEIARMTGEPVLVRGAGRTDAGVHARAQVASFTTPRPTLPAARLRRGLNVALPRDLAITDARRGPARVRSAAPRPRQALRLPDP